MDTNYCNQESIPSENVEVVESKNHHRSSADFHPSVWGDFFLSFSSQSHNHSVRMHSLQEPII